jgi:hypothetical protein
MTSQGLTRVNFLYTNIGRGHPNYLDGIIECMPPDSVGSVTDVFTATSGLGHSAWKLARCVYRAAGRSGWYSPLYNRLRARGDYNRRGLMQSVMGRPLRQLYAEDSTPLVVAHPVLVGILRDKPGLFYQHGEVAAPRESWVKGRHRVLVPISHTADVFLAAGFAPDSVSVTGLCIEPALVAQAEDALAARLERLGGPGPLCGAFFSSGAEPAAHVEKLAAAASSAVASGGRVAVFARRSGFLAAEVSAWFVERKRNLESVESPEDLPARLPRAFMCLYDDRRELNEFTERLFGSFDYFVAPSHERTHWALGLGLPIFVVDPPLGSFSPLNREFLLASRVAAVIADLRKASGFGETLGKLHKTGALQRMAESGWGRFDMRGFYNIAEMLLS